MNKYNRIIEKLRSMKVRLRIGRPKGKRYFPVSITLTQEQIDYLQKQPNASELIRKILNDLITSRKDVDEKLSVISLKTQLEQLQEEYERLTKELFKYVWKNEHKWKRMEDDDGRMCVLWREGGEGRDPIPLDNEDSQVAYRILVGYNDALDILEQKIDEVKKEILRRF